MKTGTLFRRWAVLVWAGALQAQEASPAGNSFDISTEIQSLRQVTRDLNDTSRRFRKHLDEAIANSDRGRRGAIQGADAELVAGDPGIVPVATRKLFAARMLGSRAQLHPPAALADLDRIQQLILAARTQLRADEAISRQHLLVSVAELKSQSGGRWRREHDQLRRARAAAEDAASRALLLLPLDLPETDSAEENRDRAWGVLVGNVTGLIPLQQQPERRATVFAAGGYRIALTDSGVSDDQGRRIFYQEEWVQRPFSVVRLRWRVGVNLTTGEHVLIEGYPPLERRGVLEAVSAQRDPPDEDEVSGAAQDLLASGSQ